MTVPYDSYTGEAVCGSVPVGWYWVDCLVDSGVWGCVVSVVEEVCRSV